MRDKERCTISAAATHLGSAPRPIMTEPKNAQVPRIIGQGAFAVDRVSLCLCTTLTGSARAYAV